MQYLRSIQGRLQLGGDGLEHQALSLALAGYEGAEAGQEEEAKGPWENSDACLFVLGLLLLVLVWLLYWLCACRGVFVSSSLFM